MGAEGGEITLDIIADASKERVMEEIEQDLNSRLESLKSLTDSLSSVKYTLARQKDGCYEKNGWTKLGEVGFTIEANSIYKDWLGNGGQFGPGSSWEWTHPVLSGLNIKR